MVCEIEEFDPDSGWSPGNAGPSGRRSMEDVLRPVRYKIRAVANQLKPLAGSGAPARRRTRQSQRRVGRAVTTGDRLRDVRRPGVYVLGASRDCAAAARSPETGGSLRSRARPSLRRRIWLRRVHDRFDSERQRIQRDRLGDDERRSHRSCLTRPPPGLRPWQRSVGSAAANLTIGARRLKGQAAPTLAGACSARQSTVVYLLVVRFIVIAGVAPIQISKWLRGRLMLCRCVVALTGGDRWRKSGVGG